MNSNYLRGCFAVVLATFAAAAPAAVVTVDISRKTAVSDSTTLKPMVRRVVNGQANIYVASNSPDAQEFTLKITGLTPGDQDLYVNGDYKGKKPDAELGSQGVALSIPGRVVNPKFLRCLEAVKDPLDAEIAKIENNQEPEHVRLLNTLRQAQDWANSGVRTDQQARSLDVIVAPADSVLSLTAVPTNRDPVKAAETAGRACSLLQQARDRMYDNIQDPELRNEGVLAMTPVEMKVSYDVKKGLASGAVTVSNQTDLAISGEITPVVPDGWRFKCRSLTYSDIAPGSKLVLLYTLIPTSYGALPPASIEVKNTFKLGTDQFWASATLDAKVDQGKSTVVPVYEKPKPKPKPTQPAVTSPSVVPVAPGSKPTPAPDPAVVPAVPLGGE